MKKNNLCIVTWPNFILFFISFTTFQNYKADCRIFITGIPIHKKIIFILTWPIFFPFYIALTTFLNCEAKLIAKWQQFIGVRHMPWWLHQMEFFQRYWPLLRGIHRSPVDSPQKGQWRGALMLSLICAWINDWANNGDVAEFKTSWRYLWRHCNADPKFGRYFIRLIGQLTLIRWIVRVMCEFDHYVWLDLTRIEWTTESLSLPK